MSRRRRLALVVAPIAILTLLVLGHGRLAGWAVERRLQERGVHCAGLSLSLGWDLSSGHASSVTCDVDEGPVASASVVGPVVVSLPGPLSLPPRAVHIPALTLNPRRVREGHDPGAVGLAVLAGEVPPELGQALLALGQLAAERDLPDVDVEQVSIGRGRVLLVDRVAVRRAGEALAIRIASVGPPPHTLSALSLVTRLENLVLSAREGAVDLDGELNVEVEAGGRAHAVLFDLERRIPFHLESRSETSRLELGGGDDIARLRERLGTLAEGERSGGLLERFRRRREGP